MDCGRGTLRFECLCRDDIDWLEVEGKPSQHLFYRLTKFYDCK